MSTRRIMLAAIAAVLLALAGVRSAHAVSPERAEDTVATYQRTDPGLRELFRSSAGYAVFPRVGKAGVGVGGARGEGVLFERGRPVGKVTLTQVSVGLQLGAQRYSEVIFFQTPRELNTIKTGDFTLSAQASAVALKSGASANARFENGVAVVTATEEGLMYEASVGGQKFDFDPY